MSASKSAYHRARSRATAKSADQTSLGTTGTPGALRRFRGTPPSAIVRAVPEFLWEFRFKQRGNSAMKIKGLRGIEWAIFDVEGLTNRHIT
jgi:hypothetical protein